MLQTQINVTILKRFAALHKNNRLAHAYLLVGPKKSGKVSTALAMAKFINCENESLRDQDTFCDLCGSCQKINSGHHPDVHMIPGMNPSARQSEETETIKIEQIRELLDQIKLRPFMAVKKIFILAGVEKITLEGSNCLLKTLEEPSNHSLLLLTTSALERILSTVKSRCHSILFFPNAFPVETTEWLDKKNEIIDGFILNRESETFIKNILADKNKTKEFLDILFGWIRDAILLKAGVSDERLRYQDRLNELNQFVQGYSFEQLNDLKNEIVRAYHLLEENLNLKIPLMIIREKFK